MGVLQAGQLLSGSTNSSTMLCTPFNLGMSSNTTTNGNRVRVNFQKVETLAQGEEPQAKAFLPGIPVEADNESSRYAELMSTEHPWGGVDASNYQEWMASLQQQYQALGKVRTSPTRNKYWTKRCHSK